MEFLEQKLAKLIRREQVLKETIDWFQTQKGTAYIETGLEKRRSMVTNYRDEQLKKIPELMARIQRVKQELDTFPPELLEQERGAKISTKTMETITPLYKVRLRKVDLRGLTLDLAKTQHRLEKAETELKELDEQRLLKLKQTELEQVRAEIQEIKSEIGPPEREDTARPSM
jgi:hypothetical protein